MGGLGFNLVRQNEQSKNIEVGAPNTNNEKNESTDIKQHTIVMNDMPRKNKKNLRGLIVFITMIITFPAYIAIIRLRPFYHNPTAESNKITSSYLPQSELLQVQKNVTNDQQPVNCMKELSVYVSMALDNYRQELLEEKMLRVIEIQNATEELNSVKESLQILQADYAVLKAQSLKKEEQLQEQLKNLQEERTELLKKVEKNNPTLIDNEQQTPTPMEKPVTKRSFDIFNNERFKKVNDIVKHIEAGTYLFDFGEIVKKVDEMFNQ